jgi:tyrosyl-tRNA synthetase
MGKSQAGALWLTPERTSPYEYYQQWRNTADAEVQRLLGVYTFLPMEEVRTLGSLPGAELNRAKEVLAFEATKLLHGEDAAERPNPRLAPSLAAWPAARISPASRSIVPGWLTACPSPSCSRRPA